MVFEPKGVCCKEMHISIEDGIIKDLTFVGGCNGNLKGIAALAAGHKPEEMIDILKGITCGQRPTSCPDQLAIALERAI